VRTVQDVPVFARGPYVAAVDWTYGELLDAYETWDRATAAADPAAIAAAVLDLERRWALVLLLERLLLRTTASMGAAGRQEFAWRFERFWDGAWESLLADACPPARSRPRRPRGAPSLDERGDAALYHCHLGEVSKARARLDGASLAPGDAETLRLLRERPAEPGPLGPPAVADLRARARARPPVVLDRAMFLGNVRSAPRGGAPGCSGSRFEHHRLTLTDDSATERLYGVASRLARGELPPFAREAIRLGRLTALLKDTAPGAARKVRGIVAGYSLRRLVARTLNQQYIATFDVACEPHQFALGSRAGTDAAALLVKYCCEEGRTIVQTDARGAFDHVSRFSMMAELAAIAPELVPFVLLFYDGTSTYLWTDDADETFDVEQGEGGEQGDSLMPGLFSLGVCRAYARTAAQLHPEDRLIAFLDDVFLVTSAERARAAYDILERELRECAGVSLERSKTRAFATTPAPAPVGIAELGQPGDHVWRADPALPPESRGIRVLGTPVGDPAYVEAFLASRITEERRLLARLPHVRDAQCEWLLLSLCAEPRANHLLRTAAGPELLAYAAAHDAALQEGFASVVHLPRERWILESPRLVCTPRRYGGLGLRSAVRTAPAAHFAGWAAALPLWQRRFPADCGRALAHLRAAAGPPCVLAAREAAAALAAEGWVAPAWAALAAGADPAAHAGPGAPAPEPGEWRHGWQFYAADARERHAAVHFLGALNSVGRALLGSQSGPHAGESLAAIPWCPALRMTSARFVSTLRRRAWMPLAVGDAVCPCGAVLDPFGVHLLSCMRSGAVQRRAASLERAFMGICVEARGRCRWKPLVRDLNFGPPGELLAAEDTRQLDFACFGLPVFGGMPLAVDATIVSPISAEGVPHAGCALDADEVFASAEAAIARDYGDVARGGRAALLCLASSVGGRWNGASRSLIRQLVEHHAREQPSVLRRSVELALTRRWWAVLSIARDEALAASLDPCDLVAERGLPPLDVIDVWLRDPLGPSVLGAR